MRHLVGNLNQQSLLIYPQEFDVQVFFVILTRQNTTLAFQFQALPKCVIYMPRFLFLSFTLMICSRWLLVFTRIAKDNLTDVKKVPVQP
jgi:hypothetical protein